MSATATKGQTVEEKRYVMPEVHIGQTVLWYDNGGVENSRPYVGIVHTVGHDCVGLAIVMPELMNMMIREGVRHVSDPNKRKIDLTECGVWQHTPDHERIIAIEAQLEQLMARDANSRK